jgi:hypothetical protein
MPLPLTTTLAAYLADNVSANNAYNHANFAANFTGVTWVDNSGTTLAVNTALSDDSLNPVTPCHVSNVSVHTLIAGYTGKWYAHIVPWFRLGGGGGHIDIGLNSNSIAWAQASTLDQQARGFDGIMIDWYGPSRYEDSVTLLLKAQVATMTGFTYAIMIDAQVYATTSDLLTLFSYINSTYFGTTNYMTHGGLPVVMFFNSVGGVNYSTVKAAYPSTYWITQGTSFIGNAYADAGFDWVQPYGTGVPADRYNAAATNSFLSSVHSTAKGSIPCISPGFNGYLTASVGWSKGKYMPRDSGKCWLSQAATVSANLPTNIIGIQVPTWDDWEEGSAIETAIDNAIAVTASIAGTILSWSVSGGTGDESTISSYTFLASPDGVNAAVLGTQATGGTHTFDLSTVTGWGATVYTIYVIAIGKPCIRTQSQSVAGYVGGSGGGGGGVSSGIFSNGIFSFGWDMITTPNLGLVLINGNGGTQSTNARYADGQSFELGTGGTTNGFDLKVNLARLIQGVYIYTTTLPVSGWSTLLYWYDTTAAAIQLRLMVSSLGAVQFYLANGTTAVGSASSNGVIVASTGSYIQTDITINSTTGAVKCYVSNSGTSPVINSTGVNSQSTVDAYVNQSWLSQLGSTNTYFDDFYVLDLTGAAPFNAILDTTGVIHIHWDPANGDASPNQFTTSPSQTTGNHYLNIDSILTQTTNYNSDTVAADEELYKFTTTIAAVKVLTVTEWILTQSGLGGVHTISLVLKSGSGTQISNAFTANSFLSYYNQPSIIDPNTSNPWASGTVVAAGSVDLGVILVS